MKVMRIVLLIGLLGLLAFGLKLETSVVSQVRNKGVDPEWANKLRDAPSRGMFSHNLPRDLFLGVYSNVSNGSLSGPVFAPNGGWMLGPRRQHGLPMGALAGLNALASNESLKQAAFGPNDSWVYVYGMNEMKFVSKNLPRDMQSKLEELYKNGKFSGYNSGQDRLGQIAFTPNGGWIITYAHDVTSCGLCERKVIPKAAYNNVPQDVENKLEELLRRGEGIRGIYFTPTGGWLILYGRNWNEYAYNQIPVEAVNVLTEMNKRGKFIFDVAFGPNQSWVILAQIH